MIKYKNKIFVSYMDLGMDILRGKWKCLILCHLTKESIGYLELQRRVGNISQKVLTEQLKSLEKEGLVLKEDLSEDNKLKVKYHITEKGMKLWPIINGLEEWAKEYYKDLS